MLAGDRRPIPAPDGAIRRSIDTEGWLNLAVVLDLFNREVVGWSIKPRMTADIVIDALTMAWFRRRPEPGALHHSDSGSQYASHDFQRKLKEYTSGAQRHPAAMLGVRMGA